MKVLEKKIYNEYVDGFSLGGNQVCVIGEQTSVIDGRVLEQYIYNIKGYVCENGKPFIALKSNIVLL